MAGGTVAHLKVTGPYVAKEIAFAFMVGLTAAGFWKKNHWDYQKKRRMLYDMLEKGEASVVVEE